MQITRRATFAATLAASLTATGLPHSGPRRGGSAQAAAPVGGVPVRGVVELFTSQGCSSCPPADRLAAEFARDPSLVVLSLPVDYWDNLGWKDTLAQHAFTERQVAYARVRGDGQVYTPQAVINGAAHAVGSDRRGILALLEASLPVVVTIERAGTDATIRVAGAAGLVLAAPFLRSRQVAIGRGENASARVTYTNIVRELRPLSGSGGVYTVPDARIDAESGLAVLVQSGTLGAPGRVLGAAIT